jgi:octaprenyl-diphosphate synthase
MSVKMTDPHSVDLENLFWPIADDIERVRRRIGLVLAEAKAPVGERLKQLDFAGGKMLRPALTLLSGRCFGLLSDDHIELAAMMEMVHLASLLHDDVIDQAQTRRGRTSANALWGNTQAVLLGDFVLSKAFAMGSTLRLSDAASILCKTAEAICTGEIQQNLRKGDWKLTEEDYLGIIEAKTASLFSACCHLGALAGKADVSAQIGLKNYGLALGIAFQITDDLLDILGDDNDQGKTLGTDLLNEKLTLPVINWLQQGGDERTSAFRQLIQNADRSAFCRTIRNSGAVEYSLRRADEFAQMAKASLDVVPDTSAKKSLLGLLSYVLDRL